MILDPLITTIIVIICGLTVGYMLVTQVLYEPPTKWIKGGHCGLCGKWLPDAMVDSRWQWSICEDWETECFNTRTSGETAK